jgi:oligoendopeptidase F
MIKREDVKKSDMWKVSLIYKSDDDFLLEYENIKSEISKLSDFKGKLNNKENIKKFIDENIKISRVVSKLAIYAHMNHDTDTANAKYSDFNAKIESLGNKMGEITSFYRPELLSKSEDFLNELKNDKEMAFYKQYLDNITRYKTHTLSDAEESLLAMSNEALEGAATTFSFLNNADLKFEDALTKDGEKMPLSHGSFGMYLIDDDRELRKDAYVKMHKAYKGLENTLASVFSSNIKGEIFASRARKFDSVLEASLFSDMVTPSVYNSLIEAVNKNLPSLHKYFELRKKIMGVEELHLYDMYKPLADGFNKKYTYDEAIAMVLEALKPLGEEYINDLKAGIERGWVDKYENEGKASGAYSTGCHDTEPFVLMNFNGTLNDVFTLAHELGHSMHSFYSRKHQEPLYSGYKIFVAEVASIFIETLLKEYLLQKAETKNEKFGLLNKYLESFRTTMFRQVMFAEYEQLVHAKAEEGIPLTVDKLNSWYYDLNKRYFGDSVVVDKEVEIEWARIPHFYYNFYVYKYAIGFATSSALAKKVLNGGEKELQEYLGFLRAGSSDYPINILKKAGVDLTTPKPVDDALSLFKETVNQFEELI